MTTKAFINIPSSSLYRHTPVDTFEITVQFRVTQDHGGFEDGPVDDGDQLRFEFPLESSPAQVYALAYQGVLDFCAFKGYDTPAKGDIYTYIPTDFTVLVPDGAPAAMVTASHQHQDPTHGFLVELKKELKRQADAYRDKLDGNVNETVYIGPKPLMYDYFDE